VGAPLPIFHPGFSQLNPWWLWLGYPLSLLNSPFGRVTRILENQTRLQRLAEEDGEQKWVSDYQYQRLHAVREFLADPGYSTADQIRFVHRLAPDMFGDDMCALYLTTIWPLRPPVVRRASSYPRRGTGRRAPRAGSVRARPRPRTSSDRR